PRSRYENPHPGSAHVRAAHSGRSLRSVSGLAAKCPAASPRTHTRVPGRPEAGSDAGASGGPRAASHYAFHSHPPDSDAHSDSTSTTRGSEIRADSCRNAEDGDPSSEAGADACRNSEDSPGSETSRTPEDSGSGANHTDASCRQASSPDNCHADT